MGKIIKNVKFFGKGINSSCDIELNKFINTPQEIEQFKKELSEAYQNHLKQKPK